jgi:ADP-ribosylglycohydrolase
MQIRDEKFMEVCMKMPGGGPWKNGAGQITDDSELAMCMLHGLTTNPDTQDGETVMSTRNIAKYYGKWIKTGPYDIGMATRGALGPLGQND